MKSPKILNSIFTKFDGISEWRQLHLRQDSSNILTKFLLTSILVICLVPVLMGTFHTKSWPPEQYTHPEVYNLTKENNIWHFYMSSNPPMCEDRYCHTMLGYDEKNFQKEVVLPTRSFPIKGYNQGDKIFYRTFIDLPEHLKNSEKILYFHSIYVWAKDYKVYFNDTLVDNGSSQSLNIPVPEGIKKAGQFMVNVYVDPQGETYQGLENYGDIVIGPKEILDPLKYVSYEILYTYRVWGLLPPLVLSILFGFISLANPRSRETLMFTFILMNMAFIDFYGSGYGQSLRESLNKYVGSVISTNEIHYLFKIFGAMLFGIFTLVYFRVMTKKLLMTSLVIGLTVITGSLASILLVDEPAFVLDKILSGVTTLSILLGGGLSLLTFLYLKERRIATYRKNASVAFFLLTLFSLTHMIIGDLFYNFKGISLGQSLKVHDAIFMYTLSYLTTVEFGQTLRQKNWLNSQFTSLLGSRLASAILKEPKLMEPRETTAIVMFSDLRSFTELSSKMKPTDVVTMLNTYFERMVEIISQNEGLVDKFGGDSIMATWGIPKGSEDDAYNALKTVVNMQIEIRKLNTENEALGLPKLKSGIGLHFGDVVAGVIGSHHKKEYTLIGDTVNTCSRIESETKNFDKKIIISSDFYEKVKTHCYAVSLGEVTPKGINQPIEIFEVVGYFDENDQLITHYEKENIKIQVHSAA